MEGETELLRVLLDAQSQGFLGPGDPADHLSHAYGFLEVALDLLSAPPGTYADLGTGGGVPGLVLARSWDHCQAAMIESAVRRCRALEAWVRDLGIVDRVTVLEGRAEIWARAVDSRESFELVTARSFARPAVTAEIGSGLVQVGGLLVVSEPPTATEERWPPVALERLGFAPAIEREAAGAHYAALRKVRPAPADIPRPVGRPAKRPLW